MPFEAHLLMVNANNEKVEVIVYAQTHPSEARIVHVAQVNIQNQPATEQATTQVRKMSFVFRTPDEALNFQVAMMNAESVV